MYDILKIVLGVLLGSILYDVLAYGANSWLKEVRKRLAYEEHRNEPKTDAYKGTKNKNPDGTVKNRIGFGEIK